LTIAASRSLDGNERRSRFRPFARSEQTGVDLHERNYAGRHLPQPILNLFVSILAAGGDFVRRGSQTCQRNFRLGTALPLGAVHRKPATHWEREMLLWLTHFFGGAPPAVLDRIEPRIVPVRTPPPYVAAPREIEIIASR
jgi:hypothetical protein